MDKLVLEDPTAWEQVVQAGDPETAAASTTTTTTITTSNSSSSSTN